MRFKLYLSNWMPDHFEIRSVARSKVAIMIPGIYSFFQNAHCARFLLSRSHNFVARLLLAYHSYIQENPEAVAEMFFTS